MMSDIDIRPEVAPPVLDDGDHEKFAHVVVPASAVTDAYITGNPVTALCGKTWVPTRDPKRYPICPDCEGILRTAGRKGLLLAIEDSGQVVVQDEMGFAHYCWPMLTIRKVEG